LEASTSAGRRCPLCGDLLLGWTYAGGTEPGDRDRYLLERCDTCGVALLHTDDPTEAVEAAVAELTAGTVVLPNRASVQASLAGKHWFGLELPRRRAYLTPKAVALLAKQRGLEVRRIRFPLFGRNQLAMWQTLLNGVTFHDDFLYGVVRRGLRPSGARGRLSYGFDLLISLLAALPAAIVSVPLELGAALARRGGVIEVTTARQS
jgi:hypothetical protein